MTNFSVNINYNGMNIALAGYGSMGKEIEQILKLKGHSLTGVFIDSKSISESKPSDDIVCIDFTGPDAFRRNYKYIADNFAAAVVGTTGWYDIKDEVFAYFKSHNKTLIYASNFSAGVNIFFSITETASKLLAGLGMYEPYILEMHHSRKKDAPSGTAVVIEEIIGNAFGKKTDAVSVRSGDIKGIHEVGFESAVDGIMIKHTAYSRRGFAEGAVLAAEWSANVKGVLNFRDLLGDKLKELLNK